MNRFVGQRWLTLSGVVGTRGLTWEYGRIERYLSFYGGPDETVQGLIISALGVEGRAQVVVVAARRRTPPGTGRLSPDRRSWSHDADFDYTLTRGYDVLLYELTVLEDPWEGRGHGRASPVVLQRERDPQAIARAIVGWSRYIETHAAPEKELGVAPHNAFAAIAKAKLTALEDAVLEQDIEPRLVDDLTDDAKKELEVDLQNLAQGAVLWHFPRDADGKLELNQVALLSEYQTESHLSHGRAIWLCVRGPDRSKDPQRVTLRLQSLIAENHLHRWNEARWH